MVMVLVPIRHAWSLHFLCVVFLRVRCCFVAASNLASLYVPLFGHSPGKFTLRS